MLKSLQKMLDSAGAGRVVTNSSWLVGEQVFRLLIALVVNVHIARLLGPKDFGVLSYAIAFVGVFGVVATLGLNRILVREMASSQQDEVISRILMTAFAMRLASAGIVYILAVTAVLLTQRDQWLLVAIISGAFFFSVSDCIELFFQSRVQMRAVVVPRMAAFCVVALVRVWLLLIGADLIQFAIAVLLEYAVAAMALQLAFRMRGQRFLWRDVSTPIARKLISESWPEIIAGFSALLFMRLDQIMLQKLSGPHEVGIFSVAARLSEVWYFVPAAIVSSSFPGMIERRKHSVEEYHRQIQILMGALCLMSYVAILVVSVIARPLINFLYGEAYIQSASILVIHIWCGLFVCLGTSSGSWIMAEGKVKLNLYRNLAGLAANAALNVVLIPRFGAVGAAWSTLAGLAVAFFVFDLFSPSMQAISRLKWRALFVIPAFSSRST